ncbi:MAG: hypothetical protein J5726_05545 [Treponema sp.]|nr:hypothetical protein [Treponema sp.]
MKRTAIVLVLVAIFCSVGFAEGSKSADIKYRFTNGGFWTSGQDFCGGFGEFGINCLPEEKNFVFRNHIFCQGDGGKSFGEFQVGDKLIFGGRVNGEGFITRTYCFTAGGFGLISCPGYKVSETPFLVHITFGAGFEFQYCQETAFVVEFGGDNRLLVGKNKQALKDFSRSSPVLTIGFRSMR